MTPPAPPALARRLLRATLPADWRDDVVANLDDLYAARRTRYGPWRARVWYLRQTLTFAARFRLAGAESAVSPARRFTAARVTGSGVALDLRYVIRVLAKSPGFTAVAVLSLAIGIGANTAIYGALRFAVLDPLPVDRPEQLRLVYWTTPSDGTGISQYNSSGGGIAPPDRTLRSNISYPMFQALRRAAPTGVDVFGFNFLTQVTVVAGDEPAVAGGGLMVSGNFFSVLRPPLQAGRGLTEQDDDAAAPPAAVLSHAFWRRALHGRPDVLGRPIRINGTPFLVVGVTAAGFQGLSRGGRITPLTDVIVPLAHQPLVWQPEAVSFFTSTHRLWIRTMTRVTDPAAERASAEALTRLLRQSALDTGLVPPAGEPLVEAALLPGWRGIDALASRAERPLRILGFVSGAVLLIACVNLAGLLLARGVARQREIEVRRALGASRVRLIRQLLVESAVMGALGGLAGLVLAVWTAPLVASMLTTSFGVAGAVLPMDWRSLGVTGLAAAAALLLSGLLPAVRLSRGAATLQQRPGGTTAPRLRLGRVLLALQIGISVPLVVATGLLVRTIHNLNRVELGFDASGLVLFRLDPNQGRPAAAPGSRPDSPAVTAPLLADLLGRLRSIPGVTGATVVENALVSGWTSNNNIEIDDGRKGMLYMNGVGPDFFETMRIPIVAGRAPALADDRSAPRVAVINEAAARKYFEGAIPIGRRFRMGGRDIEIVGVAADTRYSGLRGAVEPTFFDPFLQRAASGAMNVVVRVAGPVAGIETAIRDAVRATRPDLPIAAMRTQIDQIGETIGREQLVMRLIGAFGGFALVLAAIGLYGVTSYAVTRRTSEIGIRMALGAQRTQVLWLVLRQVLALALAGLGLGVPAAWFTSPLLESFLFGLEPRDRATIAAAAVLMLAVALAAGLMPARRASRLEALSALRQE
jgi:predicted permease